MLRIIDSLSKIDFAQLMNVYEEGIGIAGREHYANYPVNLQSIYAEQDFYTYLEEFFKEPAARYAIWLNDMCYVSALRIEPYMDGLLLNALETIPHARKCGFATLLIQALVEHLRLEGNGKLYSHINKENVASLKVHLSCGFSIVSKEATYLDNTVHFDAFTLLLQY